MTFLQKKLWLAWSKFRFLRLPVEKRVRLEVTTDGRHLTFILVSLYEAGYGVQAFGGGWFFRELMLLRKVAPIPFLYGGPDVECGISISDEKHSPLAARHSPHILLDYDYFSGFNMDDVSHGGTANTELGDKPCNHEKHEMTRNEEAGLRPDSRAGASEPDSLTSKLAHAPVSESLIGSADGPTFSLDTGHSTLDSAPKALRMPYFMQPGALHGGFHKIQPSKPDLPRRIRLGFYGTHHPDYYTKHFRFPILPRTPILDRFIEVFSDQFQPVETGVYPEKYARIAVSIDKSATDQVKKTYLSKPDYFSILEQTDFLLCPPGWCMPQAHNIVECMSRGVIPILNYADYMVPALVDGENCLAFSTLGEMERQVRKALEMPLDEIQKLRISVIRYYKEVLAPGVWLGCLLKNLSQDSIVLVNHEADSIQARDEDFLEAAAEFIGRRPAK
jgi:hypothetical protein